MKENDNSSNNPYYKNITSINDNKNNTSSTKNENNLKRRMIEDIIIEDIKDSEIYEYGPIVTYRTIKNNTGSLKFFYQNDTLEITKMKIDELLTGIYFLPENNYKTDDDIISDSNIVNTITHRNDDETNDDIKNDNNNNSTNNSGDNYIIVDKFYELLIKANICSNLTSFNNLATDSENYRFHTEIPKEGKYSVFMLKTRSLILMGFDGEVLIIIFISFNFNLNY